MNSRDAFLHNMMLSLLEREMSEDKLQSIVSTAMRIWDANQFKSDILNIAALDNHKKRREFMSGRIEVVG